MHKFIFLCHAIFCVYCTVIWLGMNSFVYYADNSHNTHHLSIQSLFTFCTDINFSHK